MEFLISPLTHPFFPGNLIFLHFGTCLQPELLGNALWPIRHSSLLSRVGPFPSCVRELFRQFWYKKYEKWVNLPWNKSCKVWEVAVVKFIVVQSRNRKTEREEQRRKSKNGRDECREWKLTLIWIVNYSCSWRPALGLSLVSWVSLLINSHLSLR